MALPSSEGHRITAYEASLQKFVDFDGFIYDKEQLCSSTSERTARVSIILPDTIDFTISVFKLSSFQANTNFQSYTPFPIGLKIHSGKAQIYWLIDCFRKFYQVDSIGDIEHGGNTLTICNSAYIGLFGHFIYKLIPDLKEDSPLFSTAITSLISFNKLYALKPFSKTSKNFQYLIDIYVLLAPFALDSSESKEIKDRILKSIQNRIESLLCSNIHNLIKALEQYIEDLDAELRELASRKLDYSRASRRRSPSPSAGASAEDSVAGILGSALSGIKSRAYSFWSTTADMVSSTTDSVVLYGIGTEINTKKIKLSQAKALVSKLRSQLEQNLEYLLKTSLRTVIDYSIYDKLHKSGYTSARSQQILVAAFERDDDIRLIEEARQIAIDSGSNCPILIAQMQVKLRAIERKTKDLNLHSKAKGSDETPTCTTYSDLPAFVLRSEKESRASNLFDSQHLYDLDSPALSPSPVRSPSPAFGGTMSTQSHLLTQYLNTDGAQGELPEDNLLPTSRTPSTLSSPVEHDTLGADDLLERAEAALTPFNKRY